MLRTHSERIPVNLNFLRTHSAQLRAACPYSRVQGYLTHKNPPPPQDPTAALCLGTYGDPDPRGVGVSYERGTPVTSVLYVPGGRRFLMSEVINALSLFYSHSERVRKGLKWMHLLCASHTQSPPAGYVPVSAYVGSSKNLKDLKDPCTLRCHQDEGQLRHLRHHHLGGGSSLTSEVPLHP